MRVPISWLREYVAFRVPVEELARRLVFTSCEVDRIVRHGVADEDGNLGLFRVGKVLEAGKHPNADRLQLCHVDVGEGEPRQIVCGAWNFGAGATVAVALPGALLPAADAPLREARLRGELSRGMILSERELELGTDHTGIIVLDDGPEPGTPLADVLPLGEDVLEIETGFNRPDLASIYGIAREVAALTGAELAPPPGREAAREPHGVADEPVDVRVEDLHGCPRYVGRLFRDATVAASPPWLRARLFAAGMRPISNVVDVTNYVMLALGSPLHAFDLALLDGGRIVVRRAADREEITTLDGQRRELSGEDLVIADARRPVAIAGIMGGEDSEVRPETLDLLLEAANFDPLTVLRTSRRLRLRTESSTRWERGVDVYAAEQAAVYATQLLTELAGARRVGHTDVHAGLPPRPTIRLEPELADRLTGMHFPVEEQRARLRSLGFEVPDAGDEVTVPTWRARDVTRPVDLVEEVVRFRMEEVPSTLPVRPAAPAQLDREQRLRRQVEDVLVGAGYHEAYTWTLVPAGEGRIELEEPYSVELAALRTDLEHGLVLAAERNRNVGVERIALFELGHVFLPSGDALPEEPWHVGGITGGGYSHAKGTLETLYDALHVDAAFEPDGQAARTRDGLVRELDGGWGYFELDLDSLFARLPEVPLYRDVITYPAVKQDLAFVVDEAVRAGELVAAARAAAGADLRDMRVFDVYRGDQVAAGKKSVAFAVAFQSPEQTLSDEDAAALRARIVHALAERFGAELRA